MKSIHDVLQPGKKGVFYGRCSTNDQSIDVQQHSAFSLIKEFGCELIHKPFLDEGISAVKRKWEKRPGLVGLLEFIDTNEIDFVVVYDSTRLARNAMEHQHIRGVMNGKKIPVIISSTRDLYNSGDLLGQLLKDGYSKYEADNIAQRVRDKYHKGIEAGKFLGGKLPFGYRYSKNDELFQVIPNEIMIVKQIFDLYRDGEGFHSIAKLLPENSFHGRNWNKIDIKLVITNPFYAGYLTANRYHQDNHTRLNDKDLWKMGLCNRIVPIIRYEEWAYCYNLYCSKRSGKLSPKKYKTSFLLRDILYCRKCKMPLKCKNQSYKYHNGKNHGSSIYYCDSDTCKVRIDADEVHKKILEEELAAIFIKYASTKQIDLHKEIQTKLNRNMNKLAQQRKDLEVEIEDYLLQIRRTEVELQSLNQDQPQELKNSFLRYRLILKDKISQIQKLIHELNRKITYIEKVESDFLLMKDVLGKVISEEYHGIEDSRLRRLLLYVYDRIEIDQDFKYHINARFNLNNDTVVHIGLL